MKLLLAILLCASTVAAEDSPFIASGPEAFQPKVHSDPLIAAALGRSHESKGPDFTSWYVLGQAHKEALETGEAPTIIYHARDTRDLLNFQILESLTRSAPHTPKPKIIYEIGGGRHGR